jgi:hypothetical protein
VRFLVITRQHSPALRLTLGAVSAIFQGCYVNMRTMSGPEEHVTEEQVTEQINVPKMLAMTDTELRNVLSLQEEQGTVPVQLSDILAELSRRHTEHAAESAGDAAKRTTWTAAASTFAAMFSAGAAVVTLVLGLNHSASGSPPPCSVAPAISSLLLPDGIGATPPGMVTPGIPQLPPGVVTPGTPGISQLPPGAVTPGTPGISQLPPGAVPPVKPPPGAVPSTMPPLVPSISGGGR